MKTTPYFEDALKKHHLELRHVEAALDNEVHREREPNGRWHVWGFGPELACFVRVIIFEDEETLHNAFRDCIFKPPRL